MNRPLRIAVADDDAVMRQYYQTILPLLGHEVVAVAKNGRELVEGSCSSRPDLIITDIKMGELDGIDAAAQVCQQFPTPIVQCFAWAYAQAQCMLSWDQSRSPEYFCVDLRPPRPAILSDPASTARPESPQ